MSQYTHRFFFEKNLGILLLLSFGTIIKNKFRNNVNVLKLFKSRTNFSKISQNFFLILLIETLHLLRLPKIFPEGHTNISYNILKIIQQLSQKFNENFYKLNAKFSRKRNVKFSLNYLKFLSISFLNSFYKISSVPNVLFLKHF